MWRHLKPSPVLFSRRSHGQNNLCSRSLHLSVGDRVEDFTVVGVEKSSDYDLSMVRMQHERLKCNFVHIDCPDTNNVFGTVFRTPPDNSSGLPHILEHSVLCGSARFPVRDPFFKMTKRSLNNYMNALTYSDYTMYPFATQNHADYYNLMEVYLDLLFFPLLQENDFLQEGHRLEPHPEDPERLVRSGVVYNEMKGTLSDATSQFGFSLQENLFPGTLHSNISGGLPKEIPKLTHQELVDYHRKHYHPSNALFYTYGTFPVEESVALISSHVLDKFPHKCDEAYNVVSAFRRAEQETSEYLRSLATSNQPRLTTISGAVDPIGDPVKQAKFAQTFALDGDTKDMFEKIVLQVLDMLLQNGSSAPLYKKLIESQIAPSFAPGTGLDASTSKYSYTVGVSGVDGNDDAVIEAVERAVRDAFEEAVRDGFDPMRIEAVVHQFELSLRDRQTDFGMTILSSLGGLWAHNGLEGTDFRTWLNPSILLERLQGEIQKNPNFWKDLVRKHFAANSPRLKLLMLPSEDYTRENALEEERELERIRAQLQSSDIDAIRAKAEELALERDAEQDVSCLPSLSRGDISRESPSKVYLTHTTPRVHGGDATTKISWVEDQNTNGIVHVRLFFDTSRLPREHKAYLPMLGSLLGEVNTKKRDFRQLALARDVKVGGISCAPMNCSWTRDDAVLGGVPVSGVQENDSGLMPFREGMYVNVNFLQRNTKDALEILEEVLNQSVFGSDLNHLHGLISIMANNASMSLNQSTESYARATANIPNGFPEQELRETQVGLTSVEMLQSLAAFPGDEAIANAREVAPVLQALAREVFTNENAWINVVAGGEAIDAGNGRAEIADSLGRFVEMLPQRPIGGSLPPVPVEPARAHIERKVSGNYYVGVPVPIHYSALSLNCGSPYRSRKEHAGLTILSELISEKLHRSVREKGGAYGSWCNTDLNGVMQMGSFYDPNTVDTLKAFAGGLQGVCQGDFTADQVEESLLSVFGSADAPQTPQSKGLGEFFYGLTQEDRQAYRDAIFSVDKEYLVDLAQSKFGDIGPDAFVDARARPDGASVCVYGSVEKGNELFAGREGWEYKSLLERE